MLPLNKLLPLLLLVLLFSSCWNNTQLFVAPNGSDATGDGTIRAPFATLERARDEIRARKKSNVNYGAEVVLREGIYFRTSSFELTTADSGSENHPIIYKAYKGEKVRIHGGQEINLQEAQKVRDPNVKARFQKAVRDSIVVIDLHKLGITNFGILRTVGFSRPFGPAWAELFVNGSPYTLARWPNTSTVAMGKVHNPGAIPRAGDYTNRGGTFEFEFDRPLGWKHHEAIWISGYFKQGWAEDAVALAKIDTKHKTLTTKQASLYGFGSGKAFNRYYFYNVLEELDAPGEYYLDRGTGKLYFYPNEQLESIAVSLLESPLVSTIGASNIEFHDIIFEYSRGIGVYMERTHNNRINACTFRNLGSVAIVMGRGIKPFEVLQHQGLGEAVSNEVGSYLQHLYSDTTFNRLGGTNNGITYCTIYNTGAGGIHLSGGDRLSLKSGENFVENTSIYNFNRIEKSYRAGIDISGVGNRISHCEIYNAPSMAILLHGNNHLIEYNDIHHVCQEVHDQGALYYGRDPSERGHQVRYNFFHHLNSIHTTSAVYHDDGACGMKVFGNVFYKAGKIPVLIGGGMDNPYTNNIFIASDLGISLDNRLQGWAKKIMEEGGVFDQRLLHVKHKHPPYSSAYPLLANYWEDTPALPKRNPVSKNIFYNVKKAVRHNKQWMPFKDDNWETSENPGFIDEAQLNFTLKPSAKAFSKIPGFKPIPFEKIGVLQKKKQ